MSSVYTQLEDYLIKAGFEGKIDSSRDTRTQYASDESIFYLEPELVLFPLHTQDIIRTVTSIQSLNTNAFPLHLTPRGAGTGLTGGSLNDGVIIDTHTNLHAIINEELNDDGIIYECDPGVLYRDLEEVMDKAGVYIPSYPASKDMCTIGGMVANNAAGAHSYRYGQTAQYVRALNVILADGIEYHIRPLSWDEFQVELKRDDLLGEIYRHIWELCLHHEELIIKARPQVRKNSAGYALWDVVSTTVEEFMQNRGVFDLTQIFSGSQGTLGIISRIWVQAIPKEEDTSLVAISLNDVSRAGEILTHLSKYHPIDIEIFDGATYRRAQKRMDYFKQELSSEDYRLFHTSLRKHYNFKLMRRIPAYILLVTLPADEASFAHKLVAEISRNYKTRAHQITDPGEGAMLWQIRSAAYSLSKLAYPDKRPAPFLEDMAVPPARFGDFLYGIRELFDKYDVEALVYGHAGNGHLHFYPLIDFTQANTVENIQVMAQEFFALATSLGGSICGEHNDGIIRTPYLDTMFSKEVLEIFSKLEQVCDPNDIFNPGKKVRPRFKLKDVIRHCN
ncbi:MAG: FAD-binding oxidoreductase [Patescibacteria group bacterium]